MPVLLRTHECALRSSRSSTRRSGPTGSVSAFDNFHVAIACGVHERRHSGVVRVIHFGAVIEQGAHQQFIAVARRQRERRATVGVARTRIREIRDGIDDGGYV